MRNVSQKKAFTLIEILVVIGIIALLAAILFPVLSSAREKARTTNCASNEHQIALAILQYTQDHGRRFPIDPQDAGDTGWATAIDINSLDIFRCPSQTDDTSAHATDYWLNFQLMGMHDVRLRYPANTILIGDGDARGANYNLAAEPDAASVPPIEGWDSAAGYATRHSGGANYAFADGHVKWLKASSITVEDAASGNNFAFRIKPAP